MLTTFIDLVGGRGWKVEVDETIDKKVPVIPSFRTPPSFLLWMWCCVSFKLDRGLSDSPTCVSSMSTAKAAAPLLRAYLVTLKEKNTWDTHKFKMNQDQKSCKIFHLLNCFCKLFLLCKKVFSLPIIWLNRFIRTEQVLTHR